MGDLYKKQTTVWKLNGKKVAAETPGAARHVIKSKKWYGTVRGKPTPLSADKTVAQRMLRQLQAKADLAGVGLADPYADHRKRPVADHLDDFRASLVAKGDTRDHVEQLTARCRAVLEGTGAVFLEDLDAGKVGDWLTALRADREPATLPEGRSEFKPGEVAALLRISGAAVRSAVKRHGLAASGEGRARRYPRATVEALLARATQGASPETVNHYIRALRAFCRWLVRSQRLPVNPLEHLALLNTRTDRRHDRRELSADELRRLLDAARSSSRVFRGLNGEDRFHLYALACSTGFRAAALAGLRPEDFDLQAETPVVTLSARLSKSRRVKVQPLPAEVVELLRAYLPTKRAGVPVWGGTWARDHRGAEMLRGDLEAAEIAYTVEGPDGPLFADFHALRHSYITALGRGGVDLRTAQELAGHSTPVLTARYSHRQLYDLAGAVEKLPTLLPEQRPEVQGEAPELRATGTDDAVPVCLEFARTPDLRGHSEASTGNEEGVEERSPETTQPQVSPGFSHCQASPGTSRHQRGRRDSNPQPPDRQSGTLTN